MWVDVRCKDAGGEEQGSENMQERAVHSRVTRKSLHCKRCHVQLLGQLVDSAQAEVLVSCELRPIVSKSEIKEKMKVGKRSGQS